MRHRFSKIYLMTLFEMATTPRRNGLEIELNLGEILGFSIFDKKEEVIL